MSQEASPDPITVALVEDHQMFREWLSQMISKTGSFKVVAEADNIRDAMEAIKRTRPKIAVVDISLRGSSGLELIKDLAAQEIDVPVLVLSMHDEALYAERVLRAGAKGYITKHEASSTLTRAITQVAQGQIYLSDAMTASMLEKVTHRRARPAVGGMELLADRELEVFQLIGKGLNAREIAERLNLGETTVGTYRTRIKEKLQIRTAAELYSRAALWVEHNSA